MNFNKRIFLICGGVVLIAVIFFVVYYFLTVEEPKGSLTPDPNYDSPDYDVYEKALTKRGEDGWVYHFVIQAVDLADDDVVEFEDIHYTFNVVNIKHERLPGYVIPEEIYDEDGNFLGYGDGFETFPHAHVSTREKDGVRERDEVDEIQNYFEEHRFLEPITIADLDGLNTVFYSKEFLVEFFNELIAQDFATDKEPFKYAISAVHVYRRDNMDDGYRWQTCWLTSRHEILDIHLDMIYEDGTYLTDYIDNGTATEEQKKIYENILKIRDVILKEQNIDLDFMQEKFPELAKDKNYSRLFTLLNYYNYGWDTLNEKPIITED